ncbi:hypothetical protein GALL_107700 [mine drainage metagenome]|uniref:DUF6701 domain-containing protein n=1 Tax=mine drainage metagenome TaxID=410659 RepID=A0A1J5ST29_9ZZZZ
MRKFLGLLLALVLLVASGFVRAGSLTAATGGSAISADTNIANGTATWTILTGPVYSESASGNVSTGTIVFNAPAGFSFNTAAIPTATVTRIAGNSGNLLTLSFTSITASAITFTVTQSSSGNRQYRITWANIQVRPNAGTPLASGNITNSGTATLNGVAAGANFGTLTELAGAANKLGFVTQPSNTAAGGAITPAVTVAIEDRYGNTVKTNTSTVTLAIGNNPGGGSLSGTTSVAAVAGVATFSTLAIDKAGTGYTLAASDGALAGATSSAFNITAGAAAKLVFVSQPSNTAAGSAISPAVTVAIQDNNGNTVTTNTSTVTLAIGNNPGGGSLSGTVSVAAVAGVASFSTLAIDKAGTGYTLAASDGALAGASSSAFNILAGAVTKLLFSIQPSNAAGGAVISPPVTVQLNDAYGNVVTSSTGTVSLAIGSNPGAGILSGTLSVAANAGVATFSDLSINAAGSGYTLIASSAGLTGAISSSFDITSSGMVCYTDNFSNLNNWSVGNQGGAFGNPVALSNRLRLTDASGDVSTYATLNKLFPAFGNKIVVQFTDYAYGGTDPGADGIGIILSDASVAPVAGAFGGSLGYAPKQVALGGDTTHPGFTGGWLGVGIDEYGNYSANTEGRTGGSAPGVTAESVAVRGSGSGYTGYSYMTGTSSLSPLGIDTDASGNHLATSGPAYKYRITVDHSDSVHAWTSVERDTGSGYSYLIAPYDAKAVQGQAGVPSNWYLSFTGATGASTNIHEIANLSVCSNSQQTVSLDHLELDHDATACGSDTVTIKACATADCSVLYTGNVTATLSTSPTSGASWFSNPVTFSGGNTTVSLSGSTGSTYTLGASATSPVAPNVTLCVGGPTGSTCNITFVAACFDAVETGQAPATPIYTKLSGTAFNLDVLAVSGGAVNTASRASVSVSLVDPTAASGNCGDTATGLSAATAYTFKNADNGRKSFTFSYPNAARNVRVRIVSGTQPVCSSDNFAIRPQQLSLSNTSTYPMKAGATFNLIANAGVSSGYTGTPQADATQIVDHNNVTIASGALTGSFPAATGASSSGSFQYQDVGTLTFNANAVTDPYFTAVDQVTGIVGNVDHGSSGDCVLNASSNSLSNSRYGCTIGATSLGPLGRFYPDHYEVTASLTPACGVAPNGFTYMSQPALGISLGVSAISSSGVRLSRYTTGGNFSGLCSPNSCLATLDIEGDNAGTPINPLSARLSPNLPGTLPASTAWSAGQYTASGTAYDFSRLSTADGPYDNFALKVSVADNDGALITKLNGATVTGSTAVLSPLTKLRYGRLQIANAYGSGLLALPVNVSAQYWNGSNYVPNSLDSCTSIASASFTQAPGPGAAITTTIQGGGTLSLGLGAITLSKPSPTPSGKGSVALSSAITWLPGLGRETFGIAKSPFIYLRENY